MRSLALPTPYLFLFLFLIDFPFQYGFRYLSLPESLAFAFIDAALYTGILFITTRFDLVRVTLCFLALPYFIFIPGWLNLPTALALMTIFVFCLARTLRETTLKTEGASANIKITLGDFLAFVLILIWINISGIGGYGFQWQDYDINNARLHDLVAYEWPIRYGENLNFVYYIGYFLPSAIIGKIFTVDIALRSLYVWALLGVTLTARWLSVLSKWRYSIILVIIFILFGPLDIINLIYIKRDMAEVISTFNNYDMDTLTFTTSQQLKFYSLSQQKLFFLGNYPGNAFQLYWSPQQLIAGWLCAALIMHLYLQGQVKKIVFIYALLCLWGPLVMVALLPLVIIILLFKLLNKTCDGKNRYDLFSIENTVGAGTLGIFFLVFYISGSTTTNPSYWLIDAVDWKNTWDLLFVFYLAAWGIYTLALLSFIFSCDKKTKVFFGAIIFSLAILSLKIYGEWSDLLCRGSAPLMFLLLIFYLRAIHHYWNNHKKKFAAILLCLLIPGSACALLINSVSFLYYGQTQPVKPLLSYKGSTSVIYENFGSDDSYFNKIFRRTLPEPMNSIKSAHE